MIGFSQTKPHQAYYDNGQLKQEGNLKNDDQDGPWKF